MQGGAQEKASARMEIHRSVDFVKLPQDGAPQVRSGVGERFGELKGLECRGGYFFEDGYGLLEGLCDQGRIGTSHSGELKAVR